MRRRGLSLVCSIRDFRHEVVTCTGQFAIESNNFISESYAVERIMYALNREKEGGTQKYNYSINQSINLSRHEF